MSRAKRDDPNGPEGRRNQELRNLRNEIHDITKLNHELAERNTDLERALSDLLDGMNLFMDPPKAPLASICNMPTIEAVRAGIGADVLALSRWFNDVLLASGKYEIGRLLAKADTPAEIREHLTRLRQAVR